ncbi:PREDICTED: nicotinamide/nicotinic acid mononucleotide adenylyltransferase 1-like [Rhagoletis zephyria]|uniref:nicotinamide/nicotinic acid mononucleotide adenylyltransferase 1-like n=1 Tax=Rhagoletis zephyria TaxID=28612 RepID=UPI000811462E|nr:PREDICTED: nicotinamide/nicotinic acid mononucleotide adenylyltransferase 1-like [Rhagoletis zephyria]
MHLRMFELAKDYLVNKHQYVVVAGIISPVNDCYATKKYLAPSKHRCEMVKRALKPLNGQQHWVHLDNWECLQTKWTRTLEVLKHYHSTLNINQNSSTATSSDTVSLKLLCGADLFETFNVPNLWKDSDIEEIISNYGLVVITRKGSDPWKTLKNSPKSHIFAKYEANIFIVEERAANCISSSLVRESISKNESIRYLVDDSVVEYIEQNKLYR